MFHKRFIFKTLLLSTLLFIGLGLNAQDLAQGKQLFKANCATCHNKNMKSDMTGPALGGVEERWADYSREELYYWIRNSQKMISEGHPRATKLWADWGSVMTNFPQLTDEQIDNILAYVDEIDINGLPVPPGVVVANNGVAAETDNTLLYTLLIGLMIFLAIVLARIVSNLNHMAQVNAGENPGPRKTLVETLTSTSVIGFVVFALVVLGAYTTVNNATNLNRQQGYQPTQPIKFSHATHAGVQKIDCQYCHDGARRSKSAVIPATNTCMNCHSAIKVGSKYGTAEISKIYASIGFNPGTGKYIEGYEDMPEADIEKMFREWIKKNLEEGEKTKNKSENEIAKMTDEQWTGIETSLRGIDGKIAGPIEWPRIHNLPDHAYFNHAQHVSVGKQECQTCHGKVEEMEEVYQYSPLSMGWCINCHRQTEVQFGDNEYYESYEQYHKEIKEGKRSKVTVEEIGGLECQKCHY